MEVGVEIFYRWGLKKRWGQILSSIIEERGKSHNKLSLWCKSAIRNLFKRSSHCLPQQYLVIISHAPIRFVPLYKVKSLTKKSSEIFGVKMEIYPYNVIKKSWSAKFFSVPPKLGAR